jgi:transcriptional regulator with XRE-family HTH domain
MKHSIKFEDIKSQWMKDSNFRKAYDDLELEYEVALQLIQARMNAGLTQEEVAIRMGTTQSVIARLESGRTLPSVKTLSDYQEYSARLLRYYIGYCVASPLFLSSSPRRRGSTPHREARHKMLFFLRYRLGDVDPRLRGGGVSNVDNTNYF